MQYDQFVANRRDRLRVQAIRKKQRGGNWKTGAAVLALLVAAFGPIAVLVLIFAGPVMLVLGALHSSDGMSYVPALGFWQTLGSLFVIGTVGGAFHRSSANAQFETKK